MALADGSQVVAYCSNPGSLKGCLVRGSETLLWNSGDPDRKRLYTWRAIKIANIWVGTDTHIANKIVEEAIRQRVVTELSTYEIVKREAKIDGLKVDFLLTNGESNCLVEVKNSTVTEDGIARFPDSVTPRGLRQVQELSIRAAAGQSVIMVYVAQRSDVAGFTVTDKFHPEYALAFRNAVAAGAKVIALSVPVHQKGFGLPSALPILYT